MSSVKYEIKKIPVPADVDSDWEVDLGFIMELREVMKAMSYDNCYFYLSSEKIEQVIKALKIVGCVVMEEK